MRYLTYDKVYKEAVQCAKKIGTWYLYQMRDADNLDHFIGYMLYRIDDFKRRHLYEVNALVERCDMPSMDEKRSYAHEFESTKALSSRASGWSRTCRFVQRMQNEHSRDYALRIINDIDSMPPSKKIPYVSLNECFLEGTSKEWKLRLEPKNAVGRPRVRPLPRIDFCPCQACGGIGMVKR